MQVNRSKLLWAAMPLIMGLLSLNSSAEDLVYVPLDKPCLFLNTITVRDPFITSHAGFETRTYRAWADDENNLADQGGKSRCVNPHLRTPHAVAVALSVRARNKNVRGNLTVFANNVPPESEVRSDFEGGVRSDSEGEVEGKESHVNFDNRNITNTTIIPMASSTAPLFKLRARLLDNKEPPRDALKVHVTASILGFYYSQKSKQLKNVITVSAKYGDFTNPITAMASIQDAAVDNPYLIKIGPGVYDLGSGQLLMKAHVKIQGAGKNITHLMGNSGSAEADNPQSALVVGADFATLEDLSVVNDGNGQDARAAMYNKDASPEVSRVRLLAQGSAKGVCGMQNYGSAAPVLIDVKVEGINTQAITGIAGGVCNDNSAQPKMNNVEAKGSATALGCGVCNRDDAAPEMVDVHAFGRSAVNAYGMFSLDNAAPGVSRSILEGATASFSIAAGGTTSRIFDSLAIGPVEDNRPDSTECLRNFNVSLQAVSC